MYVEKRKNKEEGMGTWKDVGEKGRGGKREGRRKGFILH